LRERVFAPGTQKRLELRFNGNRPVVAAFRDRGFSFSHLSLLTSVTTSSVAGGFMRQEVLTGIERRRRWSDAKKRSILAEVGVKGARVADVARRA